jgi:carboxylesterase type B
MSDAQVRFARTGNPNGPGLPNWPAFNTERLPTMVFDNRSEVQYGPDAGEQAGAPGRVYELADDQSPQARGANQTG